MNTPLGLVLVVIILEMQKAINTLEPPGELNSIVNLRRIIAKGNKMKIAFITDWASSTYLFGSIWVLCIEAIKLQMIVKQGCEHLGVKSGDPGMYLKLAEG